MLLADGNFSAQPSTFRYCGHPRSLPNFRSPHPYALSLAACCSLPFLFSSDILKPADVQCLSVRGLTVRRREIVLRRERTPTRIAPRRSPLANVLNPFAIQSPSLRFATNPRRKGNLLTLYFLDVSEDSTRNHCAWKIIISPASNPYPVLTIISYPSINGISESIRRTT